MTLIRLGWRAARTGTAFIIFGIGALVLGSIVFPILAVRSGPGRPELRMQRAIHQSFRLFVWIMGALGLIRVTCRGRERFAAAGGHVIVANHPTLIDVVVLLALLPEVDCVVKEAAWRNRYLRRIVRAAGYIPNDAGPLVTAACVDRLRAGRHLLLFPEGTRSPRTELGAFHRGAARIALASGCDIIPVVIRCEPATLAKGEPWFRVPHRTVHLTLDVQAAVFPATYTRRHAGASLAARRLTDDLQHLFADRLSHATA